MQQAFSPEFLGRIDKIVHFSQLDAPALEAIAEKYLSQLWVRAKNAGLQLQLPGETAGYLGAKCRGKGGARQLRKLVQEELEGPLAMVALEKTGKNRAVRVCLEDDRLRIFGS